MKKAALLCAVLALACAGRGRFSAQLPPGLPDVSRWETSSGRMEFKNPPFSLEYQLYVAPSRPAFYGVTRYRFRPKDAKGPTPEKLQWDRNGVDVRRYQCVPETTAREMPCRWEELLRGSAAYNGELGPILSVYNTHAALLRGRE